MSHTTKPFILDNQLTNSDSISLNLVDYDELALEYRSLNKVNMPLPFLYLGVLIKEDDTRMVAVGNVLVTKDDYLSLRELPVFRGQTEYDVVFRCGWCGNIVNQDGSEMSFEERKSQINYLNEFGQGNVRKVHGQCCPNGNQ